MKTLRTKPILIVLMLLGLGVSHHAAALSCREGSHANSPVPIGKLRQNIHIGKMITLSASDFSPQHLIWRSQTFTSTFTCWDTNDKPQGEDAYIYWNPQGLLGRIDPSLAIGVSINGVDYDNIDVQAGSRGPNLGPATLPSYNGRWEPAIPQTVRVSYSVYIKATGVPPPEQFDHFWISPALFQVDGVGGLNAILGSNFRAYIQGLGNINVIHCNPRISVVSNNNNAINFGTLKSSTARPGVIARKVPFSIKATLYGGECGGHRLQASFSTLNPDPDNRALILPETRPGVGIFLTRGNGSNGAPIPLQTTINFGGHLHDKQHEVVEDFTANLIWMTDRPTAGKFHATANVDVTFK